MSPLHEEEASREGACGLEHDHDGAYRQLMTENPFWTMCLLMTTFGATLWAHTVLPFGAKGAVWAYGRVADFLCHMARVCFLCPVWHCVDDFAGIEEYRTAESAFRSFQTLNESHGLKRKRKKEQKPATSHMIHGVQFVLERNQLIVAPLEDRRKRLAEEITQVPVAKELTPQHAGKLGGQKHILNKDPDG